MFVGSDNYIKYARGDGSFLFFGAGGPGWAVAAPANANATLVQGARFGHYFAKRRAAPFDNTSRNLTAIIDKTETPRSFRTMVLDVLLRSPIPSPGTCISIIRMVRVTSLAASHPTSASPCRIRTTVRTDCSDYRA